MLSRSDRRNAEFESKQSGGEMVATDKEGTCDAQLNPGQIAKDSQEISNDILEGNFTRATKKVERNGKGMPFAFKYFCISLYENHLF